MKTSTPGKNIQEKLKSGIRDKNGYFTKRKRSNAGRGHNHALRIWFPLIYQTIHGHSFVSLSAKKFPEDFVLREQKQLLPEQPALPQIVQNHTMLS